MSKPLTEERIITLRSSRITYMSNDLQRRCINLHFHIKVQSAYCRNSITLLSKVILRSGSYFNRLNQLSIVLNVTQPLTGNSGLSKQLLDQMMRKAQSWCQCGFGEMELGIEAIWCSISICKENVLTEEIYRYGRTQQT